MKTVALMRHAKSSWKHPQLADHERPLNKRGLHDAPIMGERLAKCGFSTDLIVTSPAVRAATTAREIAGCIGYPIDAIVVQSQLYLADPDILIETVHALSQTVDTVMLFGHNPGFTTLAGKLGDLRLDNLPTCGIAIFEFDISTWHELSYGSGSLRLFDYPKNTANT